MVASVSELKVAVGHKADLVIIALGQGEEVSFTTKEALRFTELIEQAIEAAQVFEAEPTTVH